MTAPVAPPGLGVRLAPFWAALATRLASSSTLTAALGGAGRVYRATDDYSAPEGPADAPWGRVVVVPATVPWPQVSDAWGPRGVPFLVRAEVNDFHATGYDPLVPLEAAHVEIAAQLHGWTPVVPGLVVTLPVFQWRPPEPLARFDPERGLWYLSTDWRVEVIARSS